MSTPVGSLIPPGARSFGKYELMARLATGGMAEIFLARRRGEEPDRPWVVIKRVLPHLATDARFVAMFRDEARLAARIEHVNACRVLELGSVGDTYFIAMEYLHGVPLSRVLMRAARTHEALDVRLVASLIQQCCAGLHAAHELRSHDGRLLDVVHRDVSPPNIFVTADGVVKLLDFGVAKARGASQKTRTGTVKGKNAYMSPEQVLGENIDRRSDLFSLGIVMWESLTATRLFMRDTDFETFRAITKGDIPDVAERRPDLPVAVAEVVRRALERDRERRYASAEELGEAMVAAVADLGGPTPQGEIARVMQAQFSKELAAKQELIELAGGPEEARSRRMTPGTIELEPPGPPVHLPQPTEEEEDDEVTRLRQSRPRATSGEIDLGSRRSSRLVLRAPETMPPEPEVVVIAAEPPPDDPAGEGPVGDRADGAGEDGAGEDGDEVEVQVQVQGEGEGEPEAAAAEVPAPPTPAAAPRTIGPWLPFLAVLLAGITLLAALLYSLF